MKLRSGFVSNSSSSSFIVAAKNTLKPIIIPIEVDLSNYVEHFAEDLNSLKEYYTDELGYEENELEKNKEYIKCKQSIKAGRTVMFGCFRSDSGDPAEKFLCDNGIPEDCEGIKIIQNEPGY